MSNAPANATGKLARYSSSLLPSSATKTLGSYPKARLLFKCVRYSKKSCCEVQRSAKAGHLYEWFL